MKRSKRTAALALAAMLTGDIPIPTAAASEPPAALNSGTDIVIPGELNLSLDLPEAAGGDHVQLELTADSRGRLHCKECGGDRVKGAVTGDTYRVHIRHPGSPPVTVTGSLDEQTTTAAVTVGNALPTALPVALTMSGTFLTIGVGIPAEVGKFTSPATVVAGSGPGTDTFAGSTSGKVKGNRIAWRLNAGPYRIAFRGKQMQGGVIGTIGLRGPVGERTVKGVTFISLNTSDPGDDDPVGRGSGFERIRAAGELPTQLPDFCSDTNDGETCTSATDAGPAKFFEDNGKRGKCTFKNVKAAEVRQMTDSMVVGDFEPIVGEICQGAYLEEDGCRQVTIARSACVVRLSNLTFDPGAAYFKTLDRCTPENVEQARMELLGQHVVGTGAQATIHLERASSAEQIAFKLKASTKIAKFKFAAAVDLDKQDGQERVMLKFVQRYYTLTVLMAEKATDVFADGDNFKDPEGQIGPGNPPVIISSVDYGRLVFFVMSSHHRAKDIEAMVRAGWSGRLFKAHVETGYTLAEIANDLSVDLFVVGGDASLALEPIRAAVEMPQGDPAVEGDAPARGIAIYNALVQFIANRDAAVFSPSSPGVPVSYELRYLLTRGIAKKAFTVGYTEQDCEWDYSPAGVSLDQFGGYIPPRTRGDGEFARHLLTTACFYLQIPPAGDVVEARVCMKAVETYSNLKPAGDVTTAEGCSNWRGVYQAVDGLKIAPQTFEPVCDVSYFDNDVEDDVVDVRRGFVKSATFVGDTAGSEAGTKTGLKSLEWWGRLQLKFVVGDGGASE